MSNKQSQTRRQLWAGISLSTGVEKVFGVTFIGKSTDGFFGMRQCVSTNFMLTDLLDCETVGIPHLMSRKTLGILDGGRGGAVDRSWRRRGIRGVDKGGA